MLKTWKSKRKLLYKMVDIHEIYGVGGKVVNNNQVINKIIYAFSAGLSTLIVDKYLLL